MNRTERKAILRRLAGRMPRIFGGSGCACKSCKETAKFRNDGFSSWPTGNPAGRRSATAYTQHVSTATKGGHSGLKIGASGAGVYGLPAGSTRAEVDAVLRASFVGVPIPYDERDDGPRPVPSATEIYGPAADRVPANESRSLAELARELRAKARNERKAA